MDYLDSDSQALKNKLADPSRPGFQRHAYQIEMEQYVLLRAGDSRAVSAGVEMFKNAPVDILSPDTLRNLRYMFVASTTLATRFAIEGGLAANEAYSVSDFYIKKMDAARNKTEIYEIHRSMFVSLTGLVAQKKKEKETSLPLVTALKYLSQNYARPLSLTELAEVAQVAPSYLSSLFRSELDSTFSKVLTQRRLEIARNLLEHTDKPLATIAHESGFSTQNYFTRIFRQETGLTPRAYRAQQQGKKFHA